ncbi:MAG TPA: hypothetical protein VNQ90_09645 [Chthoniobacteraceae bacterium]|nr:hypothetical protein [Chthoniobacteraceae bacterium]
MANILRGLPRYGGRPDRGTVEGMTPRHAFRLSDLWIFSLLWSLMLVTIAVWAGDPPLPSKATKKPVKLIRYVGEKDPPACVAEASPW